MTMTRSITAALAVFALTGCRTLVAEGTPQEIQAVPQSQSVALEVAIEKIEAFDPEWTDADGNALREPILAVLRADKAAWDQLDQFYNPSSSTEGE